MGTAKLDKCIKYMNVLNCFWENQYTNIHGKKVNHKTSPPTFTQVPSTSGQMPIWCAASLWRSFHFNWPTCHGRKKNRLPGYPWLPLNLLNLIIMFHSFPVRSVSFQHENAICLGMYMYSNFQTHPHCYVASSMDLGLGKCPSAQILPPCSSDIHPLKPTIGFMGRGWNHIFGTQGHGGRWVSEWEWEWDGFHGLPRYDDLTHSHLSSVQILCTFILIGGVAQSWRM